MPNTNASSSSGPAPASLNDECLKLLEDVFDLRKWESELKDTRLDFNKKSLEQYTQGDVQKAEEIVRIHDQRLYDPSIVMGLKNSDKKVKAAAEKKRDKKKKEENEELDKFFELFSSADYRDSYDRPLIMRKAVHCVGEILMCVEDCRLVKNCPESVLKLELKLVEKLSETFKIIEGFMKNGIAPERRADLLNIFEIQKTNETDAAVPDEKKTEKKKTAGKKVRKEEKTLLWMGTPRWNIAKLLTGKLENNFGNVEPMPGMDGQEEMLEYLCDKPLARKVAKESRKGIVLHDTFDGAIGKTKASRGSNVCVLLVEVDLKKCTLIKGEKYPDPDGSVKTEDGVSIPMGNQVHRFDRCEPKYGRKDEYNKYRVTDLGKVEIKYIVHASLRGF